MGLGASLTVTNGMEEASDRFLGGGGARDADDDSQKSSSGDLGSSQCSMNEIRGPMVAPVTNPRGQKSSGKFDESEEPKEIEERTKSTIGGSQRHMVNSGLADQGSKGVVPEPPNLENERSESEDSGSRNLPPEDLNGSTGRLLHAWDQ